MNALRTATVTLATGLVILGCVDLNVSTPPAITSVRMRPDTVALLVGDTTTVRAAALDASAAFQGQRVLAWSSGTPGVASVSETGFVTALAPGSTIVQASVDGVSGHTVVLVSGQPTTITRLAGNAQSAAVNAAVPIAPSVKVTDAGGNPVKGVAVTFASTGGGGTMGPVNPVTTGFDGVATIGAWTLGPSAGPNSATATAAGSGIAGNPATFAAIATVGSPNAAQSTVVAAPTTIAPSSGQSFTTITVTVKDSAGSTITGASVTLAATGTGNLLTQPTAVTNNAGQTTGALSSNVAESKVVSATINGTVAVTQTATVLVSTGVAAGLGVSTQPAGAVSNGVFTTQPVVDIRDGFGNRVLTATDPVTVTLSSGNGTLVSSGSMTVNAVNGRATFSGLRIRGPRTTGDTLGTGPHLLQFSAPGYSAVQSDTLSVAVSLAYNVMDVFSRNGCTGCHGFTHANMVGQATTLAPCVKTRVIAGDTLNSAVYEKIRLATPSCGSVMPLTGLMSPLQIRLVRDWILQGAPNN